MKKIKNMEVSKLFSGNLVLKDYHLASCGFDKLYYEYLNEKNIRLRYHGRDLLKLVEKARTSIPKAIETPEETIKRIKREINLRFAGKCIVSGLLLYSFYFSHVAIRDYAIHEETNAKNSYTAFRYLSYDFNDDGIMEFYTPLLNDIDYYFEPTEDPFYRNSNLFYDSCNKVRISDNISCIAALARNKLSVIDIDGVKYSKGGYITEIYYEDLFDNSNIKLLTIGYVYGSEEATKEIHDKLGSSDRYNIISTVSTPALLFEEIPTIYKSKEDGSIELREPNKVLTMAAEYVMSKTYY